MLGFTCFCFFVLTDPVLMSLKDSYRRPNQLVFKAPVKEKKSVVVNGIDLLENVPPRTENEVRKEVVRSRSCISVHKPFLLNINTNLMSPIIV